MANSLRGIHRARRPRPMEDAVWITDETISMFLAESRRKTSGYEPTWESLPWVEQSTRERGAPG